MVLQVDVISDMICPWRFIGKRWFLEITIRLEDPRCQA